MKKITDILSEKYSIAAQPGAKVECPFCGHKTLSIKKDDTIGKCFHPSCLKRITSAQSDNKIPNGYYDVIDEIYKDFHNALLALNSKKYRNAYSYIVDERHIYPRLISDSMIGAVPPGKKNIKTKFESLIEETKAEVEKEAQQKNKKKGRPSKKQKSAEEWLQFIIDARDKLINCIKGRTGWICFFYTDAYHRIVAIRFRKPYSKNIVYFKPFQYVAGLFGHGLFSPCQSGPLKDYKDSLFVFEGEFNQLQLQSMMLQYGELKNEETGYFNACTVGGVNNADYRTIKKVARYPVIGYDNDVGGAGFELVKKAQEHMSVEAFTTPTPNSDLDDYILSFGDNHLKAYEAVKDLIDSRKPFHRSYEGLSAEIYKIRQSSYLEYQIHMKVSDIICDDLKDRGKFFYDNQTTYFFFNTDKRLIEIDCDGDDLRVLLSNYGLNGSEKIYRYVYEAIRTVAIKQGTKTDVYRFCYYNPTKFNLYLFNHNSQIYRIDPDSIDLVDNGTDGVLFLDNPNHKPFRVVEPDHSVSYLDKVIAIKINFIEDVLSPDERRLIFIIWFLSLFFESIMPTKPILALIGEKGSGKSITGRKIGVLFFGPSFEVMALPDDVKDFDAALTNNYFVAVDNADTKNRWLEDRLAITATGGSVKKRKLYTTNTMFEIPIRCFLSITSRTPHFRRDDVADRLMIMKVKKFDSFISEKSLLKELSDYRDKIMTEIAYQLQEVIRALRAEADNDYSSTFRMADFADFALKIGKQMGVDEEIKTIFKKLSEEQSVFTLEDDPVFDLLERWCSKGYSIDKDEKLREITNAVLCKELSDLSSEENIDFPYTGKTKAFAQRMSNLRANLSQFFKISERRGGGGKRLYKYQLIKNDERQNEK